MFELSFAKVYRIFIFATVNGELPEWSIGADSKSVVPFGVPGVRIPRSPQKLVADSNSTQL